MINIDFTTKQDVIHEYKNILGWKVLLDENRNYHSYNDMPAIIVSNGSKFWYKHGKLHRDNDLPAIVRSSGTQEYYIDGKFIRR